MPTSNIYLSFFGWKANPKICDLQVIFLDFEFSKSHVSSAEKKNETDFKVFILKEPQNPFFH